MKCVSCPATESKRWYGDICLNCRNHAYYQANKERIKMKATLWANANREKVNKANAKWSKENRATKNYQEAMRRAAKLNATPSWLSEEQKSEIKKIYDNCPTGQNVDHIMPLRGKTLSGLHVPWNLQYLPDSENKRKGNRIKEVSFE